MIRMNFSGGYNLRIAGKPEKTVEQLLNFPKTIAIKAKDIPFLRPKMEVKEGDTVQAGDTLFVHKTDPRIRFTTAWSGKVAEIRRGHRRALIEVIIEVDEKQEFGKFKPQDIDKIKEEELVQFLLTSGLWPYLRSIPNNHLADPERRPRDIYIKTLETEPHCPDLNFILKGQQELLQKGVTLLKKLTRGNVFITTGRTDVEVPNDLIDLQDVRVIDTKAVYPAGNPAMSCYHAAPLKKNEVSWYIDAQDLIAIVNTLENGKYDTVRSFTVCGNMLTRPRYVRTHIGVPVQSLVSGDLHDGDKDFISGGVFTGLLVEEDSYLGYYSRSLHVLKTGNQREFLRFVWPGLQKYSFSRVFLSTLFPQTEYEMNTSMQGEERACIQCGHCEQVCPVDIMPQFLFKTVLAQDYDNAESHGLFDCTDCGLCNYVCPSKIDLVEVIQDGVETILKEG